MHVLGMRVWGAGGDTEKKTTYIGMRKTRKLHCAVIALEAVSLKIVDMNVPEAGTHKFKHPKKKPHKYRWGKKQSRHINREPARTHRQRCALTAVSVWGQSVPLSFWYIRDHYVTNGQTEEQHAACHSHFILWLKAKLMFRTLESIHKLVQLH